MALTVEELEVILKLKDELSAKLKAVEGNVDGVMDTLKDLAGVAAAAFAFHELAQAAHEVIEFSGHLNNLAVKSGLTTDAVQELDYAAKQSGSSFEAISTALVFMSRTLGNPSDGAIALFDNMKLSVDELRQQAPDMAFQDIAKAIALIENPMQRSQAAMMLFGRAGASQLPVLLSNIEELRQTAIDLGVVLDPDLVQAGKELDDRWQGMTARIKTLKAEALIPFLSTLLEFPAALQVVAAVSLDMLGPVSAVATTWGVFGTKITSIVVPALTTGLVVGLEMATAALAFFITPVGLATLAVGAIAAAILYFGKQTETTAPSLDKMGVQTESMGRAMEQAKKMADEAAKPMKDYGDANHYVGEEAEIAAKATAEFTQEIKDNKQAAEDNEKSLDRVLTSWKKMNLVIPQLVDSQGNLTAKGRELEDINTLLTEGAKKHTDALKKEEDAIKKEADAVDTLSKKLSGQLAVTEAQRYVKAVEMLGGAAHLSAEAMTEVHEAMESAFKSGGNVTQEMANLYDATMPQILASHQVAEAFTAMVPTIENVSVAETVLSHVAETGTAALLRHAAAAREAEKRLQALGMSMPNLDIRSEGESGKDHTPDAPDTKKGKDYLSELSRAFESLAQVSGDTFSAIARDIGTMVSAMALGQQAGAQMKAGFDQVSAGGKGAAAGYATMAIGIVSAASALAQATEHGTTAQRALKGAASGAAIGTAIFPVFGTVIGAVVGGLVGLARGLFGVSDAEKAGREEHAKYTAALERLATATQVAESGGQKWKVSVIVIRDAYLAMGKSAEEALAVSERLWKAEAQGPEAVRAVMNEINPILERHAEILAMNAEILGTTSVNAMALLQEAWVKLTPEQLANDAVMERLITKYKQLRDETGIIIPELEEMADTFDKNKEAAKRATGSFKELTDGMDIFSARLQNLQSIQHFTDMLEEMRKTGKYSFIDMMSEYQRLRASLGDTPEIIRLGQMLMEAAKTGKVNFEEFYELFKVIKGDVGKGINIPVQFTGNEKALAMVGGVVDESQRAYLDAHLPQVGIRRNDTTGALEYYSKTGGAGSQAQADFLNANPGDVERAERAVGTTGQIESGGAVGTGSTGYRPQGSNDDPTTNRLLGSPGLRPEYWGAGTPVMLHGWETVVPKGKELDAYLAAMGRGDTYRASLTASSMSGMGTGTEAIAPPGSSGDTDTISEELLHNIIAVLRDQPRALKAAMKDAASGV